MKNNKMWASIKYFLIFCVHIIAILTIRGSGQIWSATIWYGGVYMVSRQKQFLFMAIILSPQLWYWQIGKATLLWILSLRYTSRTLTSLGDPSLRKAANLWTFYILPLTWQYGYLMFFVKLFTSGAITAVSESRYKDAWNCAWKLCFAVSLLGFIAFG